MAPKNKPTAYGMFMKEFIERRAAEGHKISMTSAQSLCSESWKALTPQQQNEYKIMAKNAKHVSEKMSCDAIPLRQIRQQDKMQDDAEKRIMRDINEMIEPLKRGVDLEEKNFAIIHCHMFCKTRDNVYVPAEIAIVHFSLYDGEKSVFHYVIDHGKLPDGYLYEADKHMKETHLLPLDRASGRFQSVINRADRTSVFHALREFMRRRYPDDSEPILFAHAKNVDVTKGVIQALNDSVPHEEGVSIRISAVDRLFTKLKNRCALESDTPESAFEFASVALEELDRDVFQYNTGFACEFHEKDEEACDRLYECSLHIVRRTMYCICDHCCPLLLIPLEPGSHCPPGDNAPPLPSTRMSSYAPSASEYCSVDDDDASWATVPSGRRR